MGTRCNLCESENHKALYPFKDYSLVKCNSCGLGFLDPQLTPADLKEIYSGEYYFSPDSNLFGYSNYKEDIDLIILTAIKRYSDIEKRIQEKGRILDVGCAYGYYLDIARLHGWEATGTELNSLSAEEGKKKFNLDILTGTLEDQKFADRSFHTITAWDLVEHLSDPQNFFSKTFKLLKPGGLLVFTTPDFESFPSRIMKNRWMGIKSREHQYFFSRKTLGRYLVKNGFEVLSNRHVGKYVSKELVLNRLKYYFGPLANLAKLPFLLMPDHFYLNPFDILMTTARKPENS